MTAIVYAAKPSISDDFTDRRITIGAKIFRALLAADVDIAQKTTSDGSLRLCLLYVDDTANADKAVETLGNRRGPSQIREKDVSIDILPSGECVSQTRKERFAGIFLSQILSDKELKKLMEYANEQHIIVFSPFEGDVERGVLSGIAVEARIRPYLNMETLQTSRIRLKNFFLKVVKLYAKKN